MLCPVPAAPVGRSSSALHPARFSGGTLLHAGFILTGIVNTVLGPVLPWLTARWSLSDAAAGLLFTVQFAGGLAGGAVSGLIAARAGDGSTIAAGYTLMGAGLAGLALGGHAAGVAGMCVTGVGLGLVIPTTNLIVARLAPERSAAALGALNLCWGIGAALWPLLVALSTPIPGVRAAMLMVCAIIVGTAVQIAPARFPPQAVSGGATSDARAFSLARLAIFGLCIVLYTGTEAAFGGWITEHARRLGGEASTVRWEAAASAFWGGLTGGRAVVAVWLAGRLENAAVFCGLTAAGVAIATLLMVPGAVSVLGAAAVCGFSLAPVFPVTVAALARELPTRVAGPMVALGMVGAGTLPWVVGAISDRTGSLSSGLGALLASVAMLVVLHALRVKA